MVAMVAFLSTEAPFTAVSAFDQIDACGRRSVFWIAGAEGTFCAP
jgi:hypothetical protein